MGEWLQKILIISSKSLDFILRAIRFEAEHDLWKWHIWRWFTNELPTEERD